MMCQPQQHKQAEHAEASAAKSHTLQLLAFTLHYIGTEMTLFVR